MLNIPLIHKILKYPLVSIHSFKWPEPFDLGGYYKGEVFEAPPLNQTIYQKVTGPMYSHQHFYTVSRLSTAIYHHLINISHAQHKFCVFITHETGHCIAWTFLYEHRF